MASPHLPVSIDTTYADSNTDASVKVHQQHHDLIHTVVNVFDTANLAQSGFVPVGNGTVLVTRALLSTDSPSIVVNSQSGTTYTAVATDAGKLIEMTSASSNKVTFPSGRFSAGHIVSIRQYGAGTTTIVGSGVTIRSRGNVSKLAGKYAEAVLTFRSATEAVLSGDLA